MSGPRRSWGRLLGVAALGLLGGVLLAVIVQDLAIRLLVAVDSPGPGSGILLSALVPILAVVGAILAPWLDRPR